MIGDVLQGNGLWEDYPLQYVPPDLLVRGVKGTMFKDEVTGSGVNASVPGVLGVALPMAAADSKCAGSPMPRIPYGTMVRVYNPQTGKQIEAPLIDLGPAKDTGSRIDMTPAVFEALGLSVDVGVMVLDYRVIGGAKYVKF